MLGAIALEQRDALLAQKVAHRRIDVLVRSADVVPLLFSIAASVAIAVPRHADQMNPASWITRIPFGA